MISALLLAAACTRGDDTGDDEPVCPDEVPEAYRGAWDCRAEACAEGERRVYHEATGESALDGRFSATERYFAFWDEGTAWCVDRFEIGGGTGSHDPTLFGCADCEEIWEVTWAERSLACGADWLTTSGEGAAPAGYLMFDTHDASGGRHEGDAALVSAAFSRGGGAYLVVPEYGSGTVIPDSTAVGAPQTYAWASAGTCEATVSGY